MNAYQYFWKKCVKIQFEFNPRDYSGENYIEKNKSAYEDAKQHEKFYKDLIKEGVYPEGTKVRAKRKRHSDSYVMETWMPEINDFNLDYIKYVSNHVSRDV